jgi:membrane dipeptidase
VTAISEPWFSVDLHGDILLDVLERRRNGERQVLFTHHLTPLRTGRVRLQVLPIYIWSEYLPEGALRQAMLMVDALYQEVAESSSHFALVHTRADLERALSEEKIVLILGFEGADPLGRNVELVHTFYRLGLRVASLTWNRANLYAQGLAEDTGSGVTSLGTELLSLMDEVGIVLDLTHLSPSSFWSALSKFKGPVMASHSNAIGICPHPRNLTDDQIRAVAERGGLIGLNLVPRFVGGDDLLEGVVRHAEYIRNLVGLQCLALGPDFINFLPAVKESAQQLLASPASPEAQPEFRPDVTLLPALWQTFRRSGWSQEETRAVFAENALQFFRQTLPVPDDA